MDLKDLNPIPTKMGNGWKLFKKVALISAIVFALAVGVTLIVQHAPTPQPIETPV